MTVQSRPPKGTRDPGLILQPVAEATGRPGDSLGGIGVVMHPVRHDLAHGCGERVPAPCGSPGEAVPYLVAERLHNRDLLCHECGGRFGPTEAVRCGRRRLTA